tara:strand:+ start:404 stop:2062 length:1659 start_codon:yes stop_codon:yes gene_type:complete
MKKKNIDTLKNLIKNKETSKAESFVKALWEQDPCDELTLEAYIETLLLQNKLQEALTLVQQLPELSSFTQCSYFLKLAYILVELKKNNEALDVLNQGLSHFPSDLNLLMNKGKLLEKEGCLNESETLYKEIIQKNPHSIAGNNALGCLYLEQEEWEKALLCFQEIIEEKETHYVVLFNIAKAYRGLRQPHLSEEYNRKALRLSPHNPDVLINLSTSLREQRKYEEALEVLHTLQKYHPHYPGYCGNLAQLNLLLGNFKEGWKILEERLPYTSKNRPYSPQSLIKEELKEKTILLFSERGLGDTLQMFRYVPYLQKACKKLYFACPSPLETLLKNNIEEVEFLDVRNTGIHLPIDFRMSTMSLPYVFNTDEHTIPNKKGYLKGPEKNEFDFLEKIHTEKRYKIGLFWQGNPKHSNDKNRSISFERLYESLYQIPNSQLYSFQIEKGYEQLQKKANSVFDLAKYLTDFSSTASALHEMDVLVTVDSAIAHLGGALGISTWILLPFDPDWRWMLDRTDSLWYTSVKLFRQEKFRDWEIPLQKIVELLTKESKKTT